MKTGILLFIAFALGGTFTSCRKCITCEANDYGNGIYYSMDYCGTSKQIDDYKSTWYDSYPASQGWTTVCNNK
jgi:hypothetical protein